MGQTFMRALVSIPIALSVIVGALSGQGMAYAQNKPIIRQPSQNAESLPVPEESWLMGKCFARPINRVYVPRMGGQFEVVVARGKFVYVQFPESVTVDVGIFENRGFNVDHVQNMLTVSPSMSVTNGEVSNVVVKAGELRLSMDVKVMDTPYAASIVDVIPLPNEDFERRKADEEARIARTERERNTSIMQQYRRGVARMLLRLQETRPTSPRVAGLGMMPSETRYAPPNEARAVLTGIFDTDGYRYLELMLENRSEDNIRLEAAYISEGAGEAVPVDVMLYLPHKLPDQSIVELPAVAPVDTRIRGMVVVPDSIGAGLGGLRLHFQGPPGMPGMVAKEVIELWPRMPEHIQRRRRWAKQIAVSARVLGGGYWMGAGEDTNVSRTEGTTMTGLGARLTKGHSSLLAFEGELAGGRSGEVDFANVTWSGLTGDITRQASFGRLSGTGIIRFGRNYLTSMRFGVGLQVTKVTSTMTAGGSSVAGPGDGFDVDGFFAAGLGFDARLGEHWILGAGTTFAGGFKTELRSLEVGIHAGYRWSLAGEDGSLIER